MYSERSGPCIVSDKNPYFLKNSYSEMKIPFGVILISVEMLLLCFLFQLSHKNKLSVQLPIKNNCQDAACTLLLVCSAAAAHSMLRVTAGLLPRACCHLMRFRRCSLENFYPNVSLGHIGKRKTTETAITKPLSLH